MKDAGMADPGIHDALRQAFDRKESSSARTEETRAQTSTEGDLFTAFRDALARGRRGGPAGAEAPVPAPSAQLPNVDPAQRRAFTAVAENLRAFCAAGNRPSVVVTSATTGEGKTLCAVGLAAVLSEGPGPEVLLLEGDLRRPSLKRLFHMATDVSVEEVADGRASPARCAVGVQGVPRLFVAAAGGARADASLLCASTGFSALLAWAHESFAMTVVDTPAARVWPDACHLAREVGGAIVVVRSANVAEVRETIERIQSAGGRVLGVLPVGSAAEQFHDGLRGGALGRVRD